MALAALADVEAVSRPVPDDDIPRVTRLIEMVSASVQTYTGQSFDLVEDDEITVIPHDGIARLPQRPVTAVSSVSEFGATLDPAQYTFTANGYLRRAWPTWDLNPWDDDSLEPVGFPSGVHNRTLWFGSPLDVVYTHGYADGSGPADLAMVVAERVAAMWNSNPEATSVQAKSKTVAGFSLAVTYRDLAAGAGWAPAHKLTLDAYRRQGLASVRLTA